MLIKVCGMKYPENIRQVAATGIDLMGFIFYPRSPRFVGLGFNRNIISNVPENIRTVGVFVNEYTDVVADYVQRLSLNFVQLHGNESPRDCMRLREMDIAIIKNISIGSHNDFEQALNYDGVADYLLFDTRTPSHGGSGQQFQWKWLENYKGSTPFLLSGGLSIHDVETIQAIDHPLMAGVDLNSKFEISPANKDAALIQSFTNQLQKSSLSI